MARAAFIALVMSAGRGRSERDLDRAMNPPGPADWVRKYSVHSHISAVRRSGLKVRFESQQYRVVDLEPEQVDALAFHRLRDQVRDLEASLPGASARDEIIRLCREAFKLWVEDPAQTHPYMHDRHIFADERRWHGALQAAYARALLAAAEVDRSALEEAGEAIEELQQTGVDVTELTSLLRDALLEHRVPGGPPVVATSRPVGQELSVEERMWSRYREHLLSQVESVDLRLFGSELRSESSVRPSTPRCTSDRGPPSNRYRATSPMPAGRRWTQRRRRRGHCWSWANPVPGSPPFSAISASAISSGTRGWCRSSSSWSS